MGSPAWSTCSSSKTTRYGPAARHEVDGTDAATLAADAELRLLVHLDLGDQPARRRIPAGELDAGRLPDHAASSVAPDEVARPEGPAVGQLDVDAGVVLREAHHLTFAKDRHGQLTDPAREDPLEVALPQRKSVVVAGGEVADVQRDPCERLDLHRLPFCEEPIGDAALIEHLDAAGVKTPGSGSVELLTGATLVEGH